MSEIEQQPQCTCTGNSHETAALSGYTPDPRCPIHSVSYEPANSPGESIRPQIEKLRRSIDGLTDDWGVMVAAGLLRSMCNKFLDFSKVKEGVDE